KNPGLLVIAISLSFAYAYFYPSVTADLGARRDYLRGYDLQDVIYLWSGSIALGIAAAALIAIIYWILIGCQLGLGRLLEPTTEAQPLDVLFRMALHGADFRMARLRRRDSVADPDDVLSLVFGKAPAGQRWVI